MKCIEGEYIGSGTFVCGEEDVSRANIKTNVVVISNEQWKDHREFLEEIAAWMVENDYECGPAGSEIYTKLKDILD